MLSSVSVTGSTFTTHVESDMEWYAITALVLLALPPIASVLVLAHCLATDEQYMRELRYDEDNEINRWIRSRG